jgi:hypothetical protein
MAMSTAAARTSSPALPSANVAATKKRTLNEASYGGRARDVE